MKIFFLEVFPLPVMGVVAGLVAFRFHVIIYAHIIDNFKSEFFYCFNLACVKHVFCWTAAVQETLNQWLSKTQDFFSEVTSPLVKTVQDRKPNPGNILDTEDTGDIFMAEQTIDSATPNGNLSLAAIVSIEQFSR